MAYGKNDGGEASPVEKAMPWSKPTMKVLVAGWFDTAPPDGVSRHQYEGHPGYPPTADSIYSQTPS